MTPFGLLAALAGLSHREASDFLNVRPDTVQSWHRKTYPKNASPGVIEELKSLIALQERAAAEFLNHLAELTKLNGPPVDIELGYPTDDYEAQTLGCPCVGAWQAMAARVIAKSPVPVRLVPRGSTVATAAAADAHERGR